MPPNAKPILFEITYSYSSFIFRVNTKAKIDLFSIVQCVNSGKEKKIFKLLTLHLENLIVFYRLDQSYKYFKTVGQHPVTGESYFLFHQITPICWELQFLPFARFYRKFPFFMDNFVSVRFRLDEESGSIFLFQELKTGELISDFYQMFCKKYENNIDYTEFILRISNLDSSALLELCEYFISFTMTRTNLKLCKTYVGVIS